LPHGKPIASSAFFVSLLIHSFKLADECVFYLPHTVGAAYLHHLMTALCCAIVEDDELTRIIIDNWATKTGRLQVKAKFGNAREALDWLAAHEIDLLLVDVEMPGMTGLDLIRQLQYLPEIVVISAKADYAVHAFDLNVADYLLKPLNDYARFEVAIDKVVTQRTRRVVESSDDKNLFIRVDAGLLRLNVKDILWMEAAGDYVKIYLKEKTHIVYATLKKLSARLNPNQFVRIHRSYMVNVSKVTHIETTNLSIDKKVLPISQGFREDLLNKISIL
jgi:DNA-binding LytR/AlgR family response regulator